MHLDLNDQHLRAQTFTLIDQAGLLLTEQERDKLLLTDFGLGNLEQEGVELLDLLRTPTVRTGILVLLPNQTLPEHCHPSGPHGPGKEETIRCMYGECRVYRPGADTLREGFIPSGKDAWYTCREETVLHPGEQATFVVNELHWFQAGPQGAVGLTFQNTIDESYNVFTDPGVSSACGIPLRSVHR